jgi:hypothetical protein
VQQQQVLELVLELELELVQPVEVWLQVVRMHLVMQELLELVCPQAQ